MPPENSDHGDARNLTDRELLLRTYDRTEQIHYAVFGNGQPGLADRVTRLEERAGPSKSGMAGLLASAGVLLYEFLKVRNGS